MSIHSRIVLVAGAVAGVLVALQTPAAAAPVRAAGHVDMAWTVTDASGSPPPDSFGPGGDGRWAGADRIWNQPGFTGSYRITLDGVAAFGYCGDFHNAKSPDADSVWVPDRTAFFGSDKALAKLSYAQWRWGATTDPDTGAAMNLYTHFLGSPGDRSNSNGVPVPDINDNDVLDEIVTTLAPHGDVAGIMAAIDADAEAWSAAFDHRPSTIGAGVDIELVAGAPVVVASATGQALPTGSYDVAAAGRRVTIVTAGVARPVRDTSAGSQNSITAGVPQLAQIDIAPSIEATSQISDDAPALDSTLSDAIAITGLLAGETATVSVELFDLTVDPAGAGTPLAAESRAGLVDGETTRWAPFEVTSIVAGHRVGYRHRLDAITPAVASATLPGAWSELGIVSETATVDQVDASVHVRKTISSSGHPAWVNAQGGAVPAHGPTAAPTIAAAGSHDGQAPDVGDALPVFVDGDAVSFRYEVWLDRSSTADVVWPGDTTSSPTGVIVDDAGTPAGDDADDDDFSPTYVDGDDGDGRLSRGEVWTFEARDQRQATAGEHYTNLATVLPGTMVNPATNETTDRTTAARVDPAGYAVPCLSTAVADVVDGDRVLGPAGGRVVDVATFCNLVPGQEYVITGIAVEQATEAPTDFRGATSFTPETPNGTVAVEIEIDAGDRALAGTYVVFETVTLVASGKAVAIHADVHDDAQTFVVLPPIEAPPPTAPPPSTTTAPPRGEPPVIAEPPAPVPPAVAVPPTIPRVGSDVASMATLIGLALFTAGVVLMELRHGRSRSEPQSIERRAARRAVAPQPGDVRG